MHPFNTVFERVIGHEGNFQDDSDDRGNWTSGVCGKGECNGTKYGISAMSYPHLDIKSLTLNDAKEIYYKDWWLKLKMNQMPYALTYQLFDAAINHGMHNAVRMLQKAVRVEADGVLGPKTIEGTLLHSVDDTLLLFLSNRLEFFTEVKTWDKYGKGWARRIAQNLRYAAQDN